MGVPDTPGVAGRDRDGARRGERQHRHDHPERAGLRGRAGRHVVHGPARRPARRRASALEPLDGRARHRRVATDEAMGKVSIVGAGMKTHPGVAAKVFTDARRERHQHRDDLHLADQDLLRRRRATACPTPCARCTPRSSSAGDGHDPARAAVRASSRCRRWQRSPSSAPPVPSARSCAAARARAGSRPTRSCRSPASARPAASSRTASSSSRCADETVAGFDLALFSAGGDDARASGRRASPTAARVVVDNSSAFRMDPDVPLVVSEVNPEAIDDAPQGHRRQPELHDDGRDAAGQGAARRASA